jgi:hypothetical protein
VKRRYYTNPGTEWNLGTRNVSVALDLVIYFIVRRDMGFAVTLCVSQLASCSLPDMFQSAGNLIAIKGAETTSVRNVLLYIQGIKYKIKANK